MRVSSDKQTLILAGEPVPRRGTESASSTPGTTVQASRLQRITIIATRSDETTLLVQGEYAANSMPAAPSNCRAPALVASRGSSLGAAQYARMQNLAGAIAKKPVIDLYP